MIHIDINQQISVSIYGRSRQVISLIRTYTNLRQELVKSIVRRFHTTDIDHHQDLDVCLSSFVYS